MSYYIEAANYAFSVRVLVSGLPVSGANVYWFRTDPVTLVQSPSSGLLEARRVTNATGMANAVFLEGTVDMGVSLDGGVTYARYLSAIVFNSDIALDVETVETPSEPTPPPEMSPPAADELVTSSPVLPLLVFALAGLGFFLLLSRKKR